MTTSDTAPATTSPKRPKGDAAAKATPAQLRRRRLTIFIAAVVAVVAVIGVVLGLTLTAGQVSGPAADASNKIVTQLGAKQYAEVLASSTQRFQESVSADALAASLGPVVSSDACTFAPTESRDLGQNDVTVQVTGRLTCPTAKYALTFSFLEDKSGLKLAGYRIGG